MATRAKVTKKQVKAPGKAKKNPERILMPSGATDEEVKKGSVKKGSARILLPSGVTEGEKKKAAAKKKT